jgi:hypothetical protein
MGEGRLSLGNSEEQTQHFYAAGSSLLIDLSSLINNFAPDGLPPPNMTAGLADAVHFPSRYYGQF